MLNYHDFASDPRSRLVEDEASKTARKWLRALARDAGVPNEKDLFRCARIISVTLQLADGLGLLASYAVESGAC